MVTRAFLWDSHTYVACCCSVAKSCSALCDPMDCSVLGSPCLHYLPEFAQIHVQWVSDAIQPSHSLLPFSLPSIFAASGSFPMSRLFASRGQSIDTSVSASVLPVTSQGFPFSHILNSQDSHLGWTGLISLQSKGVSSLLQHYNLKASILWRSAFFMNQLSHPYMTTGKIIALTIWTFVSEVTSLLFNTLSRLIIAFLPRSKCFLISWLQSPSAVIL